MSRSSDIDTVARFDSRNAPYSRSGIKDGSTPFPARANNHVGLASYGGGTGGTRSRVKSPYGLLLYTIARGSEAHMYSDGMARLFALLLSGYCS